MDKNLNVIQLIDALDVGGAEKLAISYANGLAERNINSHICVTRKEGILNKQLSSSVKYVFLNRKKRFDFKALFKLRNYVLQNNITICHAHSTSYFIGIMLKLILPKTKLIFHDHYGNSEYLSIRHDKRVLKLLSLFFNHYIGVNSLLVEWAKNYLKIKSNKISYFANYPRFDNKNENKTKLLGANDKRIVCLANYRPQKDHINLINAFNIFLSEDSEWTLHLIGLDYEDSYSKEFKKLINDLNLTEKIFIYKGRSDIYNILKQSTIGLLASKSEGLSIALLEYGLVGLPVICTNVGECKTVLKNGELGILVEKENSKELANAIKKLTLNEKYRNELAIKYKAFIDSEYSEEAILNKLIQLYKDI